MPKDLKELSERIVKANPEFGLQDEWLGLEQVLIAVGDKLVNGMYYYNDGVLSIVDDNYDIDWALGLSLDQQDPRVWSELLKII